MADTISAAWELKCDVTVTLDLGLDLDSATPPRTVLAIDGSYGTITAGSAVPATKAFSDTRALAAGADALDLTALPDRDGKTQDLSGLKPQLVKIKAAGTNTAAIVFKPAAADGYNLFGDADGQVTVPPGCEALFYWNDKLADVGAGAKAVEAASADADAGYSIIIVAG